MPRVRPAQTRAIDRTGAPGVRQQPVADSARRRIVDSDDSAERGVAVRPHQCRAAKLADRKRDQEALIRLLDANAGDLRTVRVVIAVSYKQKLVLRGRPDSPALEDAGTPERCRNSKRWPTSV